MSKLARLGLLAVAMAPGCEWGPMYCEGDWAAVPPEASTTMAQARVVAQVQPAESSAVDILFVIDDSKSMTDEQYQLGVWAGEMFNVLSWSGELPDLHIGVVSSSMPISAAAGCNGGGGSFHVGNAVIEKDRFLRDVAGPDGRVRNYTGELTDTFAKMAKVGDGGCGFEQPFKAARTVLSGTTSGFLRDDALLLVVFVTDEDDCSASSTLLFAAEQYTDGCSEMGPATSYRCFEHGVRCHDGKGSRAFGERRDCRPHESSEYMESVSAFAASLKRLKQDPGQVIVAGIYGKPNGVTAIRDERFTSYSTPRLASVCGNGGKEGTGATPAVRMNSLMAMFGGRASQSSICEDELSWAMRNVGLVTRDVATRSQCLRGTLVDTDVEATGLQPRCRVKVAGRDGTVAVPACEGGVGSNCFTVEVDEAQCGDSESQMAFRILDGEERGTVTVVCDVDADVDGFADTDPWISDPRPTE